MRYIKNLINNIKCLLKHDIRELYNDVDDGILISSDIAQSIIEINKKIEVCCERLDIIEHDLNHDKGINKAIKELESYVDDKNLFLLDMIEKVGQRVNNREVI